MKQEKFLNDQQKQAVEFGTGPLLIIAGAGTGKTTVVTERIKHLIDTKQATPSEILALTFTEKSAREMEERVDIAMPYGFTQLWIGTFHSFCDRILRNEAISIGLTPGYKLMTQAEAVSLLRKNIFSLNLDYFRPLGNPTKFISGMLVHFSRLKDEDISPKQYLEWVKKFQITNSKSQINSKSEIQDSKQNIGDIEEGRKWTELAYAYEEYEKLKVKNGFMDFGDLISNTLLLFRKRPNILGIYRKQFKFMLVDEFQDTNFAQYELIKLLAPPSKSPNLTVVGDDSQSIYKFRGAAISNILSFMKDFPNAKQVLLNHNYRSTQTILDHSHTLIKHNDPDTLEAKLGISKKLIATREMANHDVRLIHENRVEDEAEEVAQTISKLGNQGTPKGSQEYQWKDFAILVRANSHADAFIRALRRHNIPYQFLGPGMLFRQDEIRDLIAYLKLLNNPEDSISFYRVLTMRIWNLPLRDLATLGIFAKRYSLSLFEASEIIAGHEHRLFDGAEYTLPFLSPKGKETFTKVVDMAHRHFERIATDTAGQILFYFLEDSGLIKELTEFETVIAEKKAQNISKFFDKIKTYEVEHEDASVAAVIDWIDLSMELGESPLANDTDWFDNDAVNILTVHSSKGLEFPIVFLVNLTTGRFPTYERREQIPIPEELIKDILPSGDYHLQEERRLFYVGMTRARDRLYLTAANYYGEGKRERKLSSFVVEALGEKVIRNQLSVIRNIKQLSFLDYQNSTTDNRKPNTENRSLKTEIRQPITYLSYSQIETFKFCPLHYKAKYILKIPTPSYAAQTFGKTLHDTLKYFYQGLMNGETWDEKKLLSLYKQHWNNAGFEGKKHAEAMKKLGEKHLAEFMEYFHEKEPLPITVEKPFIFSITPTLKVGGVIDRVNVLPDGRVEIIDYKTGSNVPTQKDVDRNLQLTVYALALMNVPGLSPVKDPKDFVLSLYFFNGHQKISTTRTASQLEKAKDEIVKIAEEIATSDFKCSGTEWCKTCEYKMLCGVESF